MMSRVKLNDNAIEELNKPISGKGGNQDFLKKLKSQYDHNDKILEYDDNDLEKLKRYANEYGNGGFQTRFKAILSCVEK